jgi:hypothetical protein
MTCTARGLRAMRPLKSPGRESALLLGNPQVSDAFDDEFRLGRITADRQAQVARENESARNIPELVSAVYDEAPPLLRAQLLECLVRPLGPLALVAIAAGAFGHLFYRLRRDAAPISPDDVSRITSEQVLELTRYVEQCSPDVLPHIGALITSCPIDAVAMRGTPLLTALGLQQHDGSRTA